MTVQVLFVCLGNICRSPMAEAVFQKMVDDAGLTDQILVDSAGTGSWHVGETAHRGTLKVLRQHGIAYNGRARQFHPTDLTPDTYLIALDASNVQDLQRIIAERPAKLFRLLDFATNTTETDVPDPYYSGNFEYVYQLVEDGCRVCWPPFGNEKAFNTRR
ncbi:MAG: low molecular weight phosphotyrosine protein phosphatase [Chloroflexi bacterium]|nr:low molecular weight phosphotyrosine protein phosphatase [Chloroflexota bacterium]